MKLPELIKQKLNEINQYFTHFQQKRMKANLEKITVNMARAYGYNPASQEYDIYAKQIAVKYINYIHTKLSDDLNSKKSRNVVPFREMTSKELFC